jgi:hypothetical protein
VCQVEKSYSAAANPAQNDVFPGDSTRIQGLVLNGLTFVAQKRCK